jgi:type I restriction enzyme S subunit
MIMQDNEKKPALRFKGFTDPWEQRKLGEVFEEYSEKNHAELPPLTIIQGGGTIRRDESERALQYDKSSLSNYKMVNKDDFIVHLRSFEGGLEKASSQGIISPAYHTFHGEDVDSRFYYAYFRSKNFINKDLKPHVYGIRDGRSIDIEGMKTIRIPWASYPEQKSIGDFLTHLDTLITLHQRKYEKLVNIKKSMLDKMFPQNGASVPEIRFKGFTDPWEQRKFEEIAVRSSVMSDKKGLPRVEYEDIISGAGRLNKDIKLKESEKVGIVFHKGDVLYGKLRPYLQNWLLASFNGLAVGDFWVLQPQNTDSSFLYRLVQSQQFDGVANQSTGTKMPRADWKLVSKTKFAMPHSVDEQAAIGAYFEHLDTLITLHQRKLEKLQNIKKSCLEKMFV